MKRVFKSFAVISAVFHFGCCFASASPTLGEGKKTEEKLSNDIPRVSIVLEEKGSIVTLRGFTDSNVSDLLHHMRALNHGTSIKVYEESIDVDAGQQTRSRRFNDIAKEKAIEATIEVAFTADGKPMIDDVVFSFDQLGVLFASVRKRQPGVSVVFAGPQKDFSKYFKPLLTCAGKAGIYSVISKPVSK